MPDRVLCVSLLLLSVLSSIAPSRFTSVLIQCTNGTGTSFCQHDSTVNQTYFATNIINSTPTGMVVATAVCSAIGPLFLGVYFLRDMLTRGKGSS